METIIQIATEIFAAKGFRLNFSEIEQEFTKKHIQLNIYYKTVEDLQLAVCTTYKENMESLIKNTIEVETALEPFLASYIELLASQEDLYCKIMLENAFLSIESKRKVEEISALLGKNFNKIIRKEITEGTVKNVPIFMLYTIWQGLLEHYLLYKKDFVSQGSVLLRYKKNILEAYASLLALK